VSVRVYVPGDMAAVAVGADQVAAALLGEAARRGVAIELVRNGSRGAFELEPLVEVEATAGRVGYARVAPSQVAALAEAGLFEGKAGHPACVGRPEDVAFLKRQTRLTFARCGLIDPASIDDYGGHGGWRGLEAALRPGREFPRP